MLSRASKEAVKKFKLNPNYKKIPNEWKKKTVDKVAWEYSPEGIHYSYAGIYGIDDNQLRKFFEALTQLPCKIIDFAKENIFFTSAHEGYIAECYNLKGARFKLYNFLVVFHEETWRQNKKEFENTVAHEIAHAYLEHDILGEIKQELDADKQAGKWLGRQIYNYKRLLKKHDKINKKHQ